MRSRAKILCAMVCTLMVLTSVLSFNVALGHGWVTNPPSRQEYCAKNLTGFDCGAVKYEPQSVEAPKGSMQCSGGGSFSILNDSSRTWPVANVGSTITVQWNLTAAHRTSTWEYFVDGQLFRTFDQGGTQPPSNISHTLSGLPSGRHLILARWNIYDTVNAFYNCIDINVGGTTNPTATRTRTATTGGTLPTATRTRTATTGGTLPTATRTRTNTPGTGAGCWAAWNSTTAYNGGAQVSYNGQNYQAAFWTQNQNPATNSGPAGSGQPWIPMGACGGTTNPTATRTATTGGTNPTATRTNTTGTGPTATRPPATNTPPPTTSGQKVVGYFVEWGVYGRQYFVKNIHTSGSASKLTHILYAFGNTTGGQCAIGDAYADYDMAYTAANSVDGVADTWDAGVLRGSFGQLRKLKAMYPHIKVLYSIGGWTWSGGFTQAAANPTAFANSCYNMIEDPRWADVFDGIDIDWEYPNACGLSCDASGFSSFKNVMAALRTRFGSNYLITAAITADGTNGGKIDAADYGGAAQYVDWYMPMTYDYFGAFAAQGPTAPHSPLHSYTGIPTAGFYSDAAIQKLKSKGIPSSKILLGIGFYGRGWTGVTQAAPGGTATGAAPGTYEAGIEDYKVLKTKCPANGTVGGTAYCFSGGQWWGYDTVSTVIGKMNYKKGQGLGGTFFWELSGDTTNGELITAIANND